MKRYLIIVCAELFALPFYAQHVLDSVQICALLYPDGHAYVQEERTMMIGDGGTECYISFNAMDGMSVTLEGVSDERGIEYLVEPSWNVNRSREQKAGRCGLNRTSSGYELCWGLGSSGRHKYRVYYNLYGLVKSHPDADGFNHCFYQAASPAARYGSVYIMLNGEEFGNDSLSLTPDSARVWAFGFHGDVGFYAGCVAAYTTEPMSEDDNITVMMEFDKGMFTPERSEVKLFSLVKAKAFEGSDYNLNDSCDGSGHGASLIGGNDSGRRRSDSDDVNVLDVLLGLVCCCGSPLFLLLFLIVKRGKERSRIAELQRRENSIAYVYEPPLDARLMRSQLIVLASLGYFHDDNGRNPISQRELLQAIVLRMIYTKRISLKLYGQDNVSFLISNPSSGEFRDGTDEPDEFTNLFDVYEARVVKSAARDAHAGLNDTSLIHGLHTILYEAAGADHILQSDELRTYISSESHQLRVRPYARLISSLYYPSLDAKRIDAAEIDEVYGFYKYLRDFAIMPERHIQEVALWQEFMVFAALFDLTKQVCADLRRINPDMSNLDQLTQRYLARPVQDAVSVFVSSISYSISESNKRSATSRSGYVRSYSNSNSSSYSRSSGGGGRSSYRGGGGHTGGGGSGVR